MYINSMDGYSEWQCNAETVQENRMPYSCGFIPYANPQEAAAMNPFAGSRVLLHNGEWKFRRFDSHSFTADFFKTESASTEWETVSLPHCPNADIQLQDGMYPWEPEEECIPPYAPTEKNCVFCYTHVFNLEPQYAQQRVIISFGGVSSAFYLYVNGERAGFSKSAFACSRFDITDFLNEGRNLIAVEVHAFSTASWLDGEEAWRLAGIFRDVTIYYTHEHFIEDFTVSALPDSDLKDGALSVSAKIAGSTDGVALELTVMDCSGKMAALDRSFIKSNGKANLSATVVDVDLWSCEAPSLYKIILTLKCDSRPIESVSLFTGFRRVEIKGGVLLINGRRAVLKGICMHECNGQQLYTKSELENAVSEMKRANINALRIPYHPADSFIYDLCDRFGIYVIDENNIFSEYTKPLSRAGGAYLPGSRGEWTALCRDRAEALYHGDKNHACVIGRAVNDPSGGGNGVLMREYLEDMDSSRFLMIDPDGCPAPGDRAFVTSFKPESPLQVEQYTANRSKRPVLLSDYAHCAGNSCGSLEDYISLFHTYPTLQGGFLANWNDLQNAGGFTPILEEIRMQYADIVFSPVYPARGIIDITNHCGFTDLSSFTICWKVTDESGVLGQGFLVVAAAPGSTVRVELPIPAKLTNECYLNIYALTSNETQLAPKGTQAAFRQFVINAGKKENPASPAGDPALTVTETHAMTKVVCEDFEIKISRRTGLMSDFSYRGKKVLASPILPDFWRAPTQWERKIKKDVACAAWRYAGESCTGTITDTVVAPDNSKAVIETQLKVPLCPDFSLKCTYTVQPEEIHVSLCGTIPKHLPLPPCVGLRFKLDDAFTDAVYLGNGPMESYKDRLACAPIGRYSEKWQELTSPYDCGQEYGNHFGVRYAEISSPDCTLRIEGEPTFEFSLLPYSHEELENGIPNPQNKHPNLSLRAWQSGVGETSDKSLSLNDSNREFCLNFAILPMAE